MWKSLLTPVFAVAIVGCSASGSATIEPNPGASLTVVNDSDFVLEQIYLTEVDNPDW